MRGSWTVGGALVTAYNYLTGLRPSRGEGRPVAASRLGSPAWNKAAETKRLQIYKECGGFVLLSTGVADLQSAS